MALSLALNIDRTSDEEVSPGRLYFSAIKDCASALKLAKEWRPDVHWLTDGPFAALQVSNLLSLASFLAHAEVREEIRVLMSLANKAPAFAADIGIDVTAEHGACWAAQAAYETDGLVVSVPRPDRIRVDFLNVAVSQMSSDADLFEEHLRIEHIFDAPSCAIHRPIIESRGRGIPLGGAAELWRRRSELFPHLIFLSRVEKDLMSIADSAAAFSQIYSRLVSIDASARDWCSGRVAYPCWAGKITNESSSRAPLCDFADDSGGTINYQLHARYTPGAGRIHFRTIDDLRLCEIAYIGQKIEK